MKRRNFLLSMAALPAAPVAASDKPRPDLSALMHVIEQLEAGQGWESSGTVAAKAFAAWQMRKALGLALPDPRAAQTHVDYQRQTFEDYRRSCWFERDIADGKQYYLAPMERALT